MDLSEEEIVALLEAALGEPLSAWQRQILIGIYRDLPAGSQKTWRVSQSILSYKRRNGAYGYDETRRWVDELGPEGYEGKHRSQEDPE